MFKSRTAFADIQSEDGIIGKAITISGHIDSQGHIVLSGHIDGDINCQNITITSTGQVTGNISAQMASIDGRVEGDIHAESLRILAHAHITGKLSYATIEVAEGAKIEGSFMHKPPPPPAAPIDKGRGKPAASAASSPPAAKPAKRTESPGMPVARKA